MFTPDEVAGIVDIFGSLTREETSEALSELAYRRGEELSENLVRDALSEFVLIEFEHDGKRFLTPGPAAFPELPEGAEDLPHILDIDPRPIDRTVATHAAAERLRTEAVCAATVGAHEHADRLLDISYDLETWGHVDLTGVRARLDAATDGTN